MKGKRIQKTDNLALKAGLWIRIRIGNPDPGSGSRGNKVKEFQWKMHFLVFLKQMLPLKMYKIALTTY
jgi:hypothetical protein